MNAQAAVTVAPHGGRGLYPDPPVLPAGGIPFCLLLFLLFRLLPASAQPDEEATSGRATTRAVREAAHAALPTMTSPVAMLLESRGGVELRDAQGASLGTPRAQLALHAGDGVRTLTRSRALLRLGSAADLELSERSRIALAAPVTDLSSAAVPGRATLVAGAVAGTFGVRRSGGAPFELELPGARLSLAGGGTAAGDLHFLASRNSDSTSTISLLSGRARLAGSRGAESLTAGYGVTLDAHGIVRERRALPPAPGTMSPPGGSVVAYREVPPRIEFSWSTVGSLARYRLRVARDAHFRDLLVDERVDAASRSLSDLRAGEIYWSVSSLDGRYEGRASIPRRLRILRDSDAPALTVEAVVEAPGPVVIRGRTEAGARVYVQGEAVAAGADGAFETRIARRPGAFVLLVEAVDAVGNVSSESRIVGAHDAERAAVADTETGL